MGEVRIADIATFRVNGYSYGMTASEPCDQSSEFSKAWRRSFGFSPPLGHVLRYDHFDAWTRFHSLPGSKRYAECDEETGIIVERANTLASECFGEQASVWVSAGYHSDFDLENDDLPIRMNMSKAMVWIDEDEEPEDHSEMSFLRISASMEAKLLGQTFSGYS